MVGSIIAIVTCLVLFFCGYRDEKCSGMAADRLCRLIAPGQPATPELLATLYIWQSRLKRVSAECLPVAAIECSAGYAVGMRRP